MSAAQLEQDIDPLVPENVLHNEKLIAFVRNMTSPIFGVVAGTLGLTSYSGFLFYALSSLYVSGLMVVVLTRGRPENYVRPAWSIWGSQIVTGISSYMLTWTLFYGLVHGTFTSYLISSHQVLY